MTSTIYWLKHGPIERRPLEIVGSGTDRDLSKFGIQQAELMAQGVRIARDAGRLETIDPTIFSSPMKRAKHTAEIIAEANALDVELVPELRAQNFGALEGKTIPELEEDPDLAPYLYGNIRPDDRFVSAAPQGESQLDMWRRAIAVRRRFSIQAHNPLLITHGSVLNPIIGTIRNLQPYDWDNQNTAFQGHIIVDTGDGPFRSLDVTGTKHE